MGTDTGIRSCRGRIIPKKVKYLLFSTFIFNSSWASRLGWRQCHLHHTMKTGCLLALLATSLSNATAFSTAASPRPAPTSLRMQRRDIIDIFAQATVLGTAAAANALDMDSFENSLLEKDTTQCDPKRDPKCIPKLTPDEALCKYGVSGSDARTAACKRVRDAGGLLPTSKPGERNTAGWVNNPIAL